MSTAPDKPSEPPVLTGSVAVLVERDWLRGEVERLNAAIVVAHAFSRTTLVRAAVQSDENERLSAELALSEARNGRFREKNVATATRRRLEMEAVAEERDALFAVLAYEDARGLWISRCHLGTCDSGATAAELRGKLIELGRRKSGGQSS